MTDGKMVGSSPHPQAQRWIRSIPFRHAMGCAGSASSKYDAAPKEAARTEEVGLGTFSNSTWHFVLTLYYSIYTIFIYTCNYMFVYINVYLYMILYIVWSIFCSWSFNGFCAREFKKTYSKKRLVWTCQPCEERHSWNNGVHQPSTVHCLLGHQLELSFAQSFVWALNPFAA